MNCRKASSANKAAAAAVLLLAMHGAWAQDTSCRVLSTGGVTFDGYDTLSTAPLDSTGSVQVRCDRVGGPRRVTLTLALGPSAHSGTTSTRRMLGPTGDFLSYGLFRDVGRSAPWGVTPGVDAGTVTIDIPNRDYEFATFVIYGRVPGAQNVSTGVYSDRVQITLSP